MTKTQSSLIPAVPPGKHALRVVSPKVTADWQKLATTVEQFYGPSYRPAGEYLRKLIQDHFHASSNPEPLPWLRNPGPGRFAGEAVMDLHKCVLDAVAPSVPLRAVWQRQRQQ